MTSYLRSWLYSQASESSNQTGIPTIIEQPSSTNALPDDDDDSETVHGEDEVDDHPPSFPSVNSAQRLAPRKEATVSGIPRILTDAQLMPPPPPPSANDYDQTAPEAVREAGKVALAPGHGPLDWANLKKSGRDLRGVDTLLRVNPAMLKQHNTREDAWSAFNGKVYNITPYLPYHPGGEKELMRVAGRDGSKLFALTHAWVNLDYMLDACLVGFLVPGS